MIQTTPSTIKYGTLETYQAIVAAEAARLPFRFACTLTMAVVLIFAMKALKAGYTSVMIDGSKLDYEGNIEVSKKVADVAVSWEFHARQSLVRLVVRKTIWLQLQIPIQIHRKPENL